MGHIGFPELVLIAVIILLLFGARRLPEIARAVGRALKEFRKTGREMRENFEEASSSGDDRKSDSRPSSEQ